MRRVLPEVSERRACRVLGVSRSSVRPRPGHLEREPQIDAFLADRIAALIRQHPTYGYRRLWALLRYGEGHLVNRKKVYRILKLKGWLVHQRRVTPRPRARGVAAELARATTAGRWT